MHWLLLWHGVVAGVVLLVIPMYVDAECLHCSPEQLQEDLAAVAAAELRNTLLNTIQGINNLTHSFTEEHASRSKECPAPFTKLVDQCFYINKIENLDFEASRKSCQAMGADLAHPKYPQALRAYIWDKLGDTGSKFKLGGSDLQVEGVWRWLSGEAITEWWSPGQPDDWWGQDCLYLQCNTKFKLPLDDGDCGSGSHFICEYVR